ncbi:hypothetical protein [Listeria kieliensis]|uniref:hypothetical protein n=1 Tax=Listeria kieliensis TaxID=1621700 RepID=UPI000E216A65|nr:hypothetical protein [Listeria kieliensis]
MKRWKVVFLVVLILIIGGVVGYKGYIYFKTKQANHQIDQAIHKIGIPKNEIIVIENPKYNAEVFGNEWFTKEITTKKDYQTWKNMVRTKHEFLNGKKLTSENKNKLNFASNCELTYSFTYQSANKSVDADSAYGDNSATKEQENAYFAYKVSEK